MIKTLAKYLQTEYSLNKLYARESIACVPLDITLHHETSMSQVFEIVKKCSTLANIGNSDSMWVSIPFVRQLTNRIHLQELYRKIGHKLETKLARNGVSRTWLLQCISSLLFTGCTYKKKCTISSIVLKNKTQVIVAKLGVFILTYVIAF